MSIAIDTNYLVRILVQDPPAPDRCVARRLVADDTAADGPLPTLYALLMDNSVEGQRKTGSKSRLEATRIRCRAAKEVLHLSCVQERRNFAPTLRRPTASAFDESARLCRTTEKVTCRI